MTNVLEGIVADKRNEVAALKHAKPLDSFIHQLTPSDRDFFQALAKPGSSFILECKKASPSKGLIRDDFDLEEISRVYGQYADAISVLTDEKYFQGHFDYLSFVRERVSKPVLNKDFFIDPYQVYLARHIGADAILLMLSVLNDEEYKTLSILAEEYKLDVLTEVSNQQELDRALLLDAKIIGINNRNLRDLTTDLETTRKFAPQIPENRVIVSESGIYTNRQVRELADYANAFLVGSSLMAEDNLEHAVRRLVYGSNKVCGLTRREDAVAAHQAGAVFGGLIFAEESPRCIDLETAKQVSMNVPLGFVGVFVNQPIEQVCEYAEKLSLAAVQLHGEEDQHYLNALSEKLPCTCEIWKALGVYDQLPEFNLESVDRFVLDTKTQNQRGGSGQSFDWALLAQLPKQKCFMLAGGVKPENIKTALQYKLPIDLNSGVESEPGVKDKHKINAAFQQIKQY